MFVKHKFAANSIESDYFYLTEFLAKYFMHVKWIECAERSIFNVQYETKSNKTHAEFINSGVDQLMLGKWFTFR